LNSSPKTSGAAIGLGLESSCDETAAAIVVDGRTVLSGINLEVKTGETMVIMGGSGCGKSTLLRHLVGYYRPDQGEILFDGKDIAKMTEAQLDAVRKKFGILFQSGALLNSLSVGENVALPLREHSDLNDEIIKSALVTHEGKLVHEGALEAIRGGNGK